MEKDYFAFMQKILNKGNASPVPLDDIKAKSQPGKVWYLPHFGVYNPKKPTQIQVVFDLLAEYSDVSLNKELLPGPDLMNSLLGVLIHFRGRQPPLCVVLSRCSTPFTWIPITGTFYASCGLRTTNLESR